MNTQGNHIENYMNIILETNKFFNFNLENIERNIRAKKMISLRRSLVFQMWYDLKFSEEKLSKIFKVEIYIIYNDLRNFEKNLNQKNIVKKERLIRKNQTKKESRKMTTKYQKRIERARLAAIREIHKREEDCALEEKAKAKINAISLFYKIGVRDILGKSKNKEIIIARDAAIWSFWYENQNFVSLAKTGKIFKRDHVGVIFSIARHMKRVGINHPYVQALEDRLKKQREGSKAFSEKRRQRKRLARQQKSSADYVHLHTSMARANHTDL